MITNIKQTYFGTADKKLRNITWLILAILIVIFAITQIVKVAVANANPLFAFAYVEDSSPSEAFPIIGICPGSNQTHTGVISDVRCSLLRREEVLPITIGTDSFAINGKNLNCIVANPDQKWSAQELADMIKCEVWSDLHVITAYFDKKVRVPSNWFDWTVIPSRHDTAIGLIKWFFNGQDLGYQVQTVQDEYRFNRDTETTYSSLFTVQFDFMGEGKYGEVIQADFWTSVGVVGGYIFLASHLYKCVVWSGYKLFNIQPDSIPNNYEPIR